MVGVLQQRVATALREGNETGCADPSRGAPDLLAHLAERPGRPGDNVERVGAQGGVEAAFTNHGRDPLGGVSAHQLDQGGPFFTQQIEERVEGGLVPTHRGPDEPSAVVVDDHGQVLVTPAVADLVDANAGQSLEGIASGSTIGHHPGDDGAYAAPRHSHQLGDRRLRGVGLLAFAIQLHWVLLNSGSTPA